jgi:hypothetical protein
VQEQALVAHREVGDIEKSHGLPRIVLTGFGDSSVNMQILAYVLTTDFGEFVKIQERLILDIISAVEAAGTGVAFPSQTAYLARDEGLDATKKRRIEEEMQSAASGQRRIPTPPWAQRPTTTRSAPAEGETRARALPSPERPCAEPPWDPMIVPLAARNLPRWSNFRLLF